MLFSRLNFDSLSLFLILMGRSIILISIFDVTPIQTCPRHRIMSLYPSFGTLMWCSMPKCISIAAFGSRYVLWRKNKGLISPIPIDSLLRSIRLLVNKAGYTAQDAPSMRLKITRDRRTYGPMDGPTDGRTDGHTLF